MLVADADRERARSRADRLAERLSAMREDVEAVDALTAMAPAPATQEERYAARDALNLPGRADDLARALAETGFAPARFEAALALGNPPWRIAFSHILPNILPSLLVQATLSIAAAIIAEAALSFLGLGQQPPSPSWGSMLNASQRFLSNAPWMALWPGLAIFIVVLSFNLFGDGLRDALDPNEK